MADFLGSFYNYFPLGKVKIFEKKLNKDVTTIVEKNAAVTYVVRIKLPAIYLIENYPRKVATRSIV